MRVKVNTTALHFPLFSDGFLTVFYILEVLVVRNSVANQFLSFQMRKFGSRETKWLAEDTNLLRGQLNSGARSLGS